MMLMGSTVTTYLVVYYTYGRHTWDFRPPNINSFSLTITVRGTFAITAIVWAKTAFAFTLLRITTGWTRRLVWVIIVSMNVLMGVSAMVFWIQCTPLHKAWTPTLREGKCWPPKVLEVCNLTSGGMF